MRLVPNACTREPMEEVPNARTREPMEEGAISLDSIRSHSGVETYRDGVGSY